MLGMLSMCFVANTSLCVCWHLSFDTGHLLDLQRVPFSGSSAASLTVTPECACLGNEWHPVLSSRVLITDHT